MINRTSNRAGVQSSRTYPSASGTASLLILTLVLVLSPARTVRGLDGAAPSAPADAGKIRIAIYCDQGSLKAAPGIEKCMKAVADRYCWKRVTADEIRHGALRDCKVVVQGGGSGSKQAKTLEQAGRDEIRKFVEAGGGYLGICAGAYLATSDYDWSLRILNAKVIDRQHWARGGGMVTLQLTPPGREFLGLLEASVECRYNQGPLLAPAAEPALTAYTPVAHFGTEIATKGAPKGVMVGTTAMAYGKFGKGRVFVSSPHPEATRGLDGIIRTAVAWLAKQESSAGR